MCTRGNLIHVTFVHILWAVCAHPSGVTIAKKMAQIVGDASTMWMTRIGYTWISMFTSSTCSPTRLDVQIGRRMVNTWVILITHRTRNQEQPNWDWNLITMDRLLSEAIWPKMYGKTTHVTRANVNMNRVATVPTTMHLWMQRIFTRHFTWHIVFSTYSKPNSVRM